VSQLPLLVSDPGKQAWFWQVTVTIAGILLALNLLLIVLVYARHLRAFVRARRTARFKARFEPVIAELAAGEVPSNRERLRRQIADLHELERPLAALMLLERLRPASPEQRAAMLGALRDLGAVDLMLRGTKRWRPWRKVIALRTLGWLGATEGVFAAMEHLRDKNRYVRDASLRALGRIGDEHALPQVEQLFLDPDRRVSAGFVYEALVSFGPAAAPAVEQGLGSADEHVRVSSCFATVSALEPAQARPLLEGMLSDPSPPVRTAAAEVLGHLGGDQLPAELARAVQDVEASVRRAAAGALGSFDDAHAVDLLLEALDDPDRQTVVRAGESLVRLSRLPRARDDARLAFEGTVAWPLERARTLASLEAL
jgi:HEAT repeat protein